MFEIKVSIDQITGYEHFPGLVKCSFYDAWNHKHLFVDKFLIFTCENITPESIFPQKGTIRCELIRKWVDNTGRSILTVSTEKPDHVESLDGATEFDLLESQITIND